MGFPNNNHLSSGIRVANALTAVIIFIEIDNTSFHYGKYITLLSHSMYFLKNMEK